MVTTYHPVVVGWEYKFYSPGTPIEAMESIREVTPQTMGFLQQEYKWFTHHPEDMYDFIKPDIHVNPATIQVGPRVVNLTIVDFLQPERE